MKKVWLIAHRHDQPALVTELQNAGAIEVEAIDGSETIPGGADEQLFAARAEQLALELTKVQFVLDFFAKTNPPKKGLIASLMKDRLVISRARFDGIDEKLDFEDLYLKCEEYEAALAAVERDQKLAEAELAELRSWSGFDGRFDELKASKYLGFAVGKVKRTSLSELAERLAEVCPESEIFFAAEAGAEPKVVIAYFLPHRVTVERALANSGFEHLSIEAWSSTPEEEIMLAAGKLERAQVEQRRIEAAISGLLALKADVMILRDWLRARQIRYEAQSRFGRTASTFLLQGWIEAAKADELSGRLSAHEAVVDFSFSDPGPDDQVPIMLRNPAWARPFEVLTRLYGVPNYRELDPTPTMGFFFFLFFGIALGDFGYGLTLGIFCFWLRRKLLLSDAGRQWLDVFILGGLSSMIFGVLTGSYFGLDIKSLPTFLRSLMIIDPLQQAFIFLVATWAIGAIHVMTGLILEFADSWRHKDYSAVFYNDLPLIALVTAALTALTGWLAIEVFSSKVAVYQSVLSAGVTALGISGVIYILLSGGFFSGYVDVVRRLFGWAGDAVSADGRTGDMIAIGVLLIVLTAVLAPSAAPMPLWPAAALAVIVGLIFSSPVRHALGNLGLGLYNVYGMSSFIGDILSYSRLMALGLATFLIGFVINTLAGLVAGFTVVGLPLGILLALLIAIPLHIVNLAINLLGAFVHPLRLQFVEFFSKFYEDGGKAFRPFAFETDHLVFKEE